MKITQDAEDLSIANLLISFLVRFPTIFTLNYNLVEDKFRFSFMLTKKVEGKAYSNFKRKLHEHLQTYREILNMEIPYPQFKKRTIDSWTLLEVTWNKKSVSFEEVGLVSTLIFNEFKDDVVVDLRANSYPGNDLMHGDDLTRHLFLEKGENIEKNLFAFRESGKVYIFDK